MNRIRTRDMTTRAQAGTLLGAALLCALAALLTVSGCDLDPQSPPALNTGSADFTRIVAVGNSLTAGFQSGALVEDFQALAFPALIAMAAGHTVGNDGFSYPNISYPGIGADPTGQPIAQLGIAGFDSPCSPDIQPIAGGIGSPTNTAFQGIYSNLGVPGARVSHLLLDPTLLAANPFFAIVARPSAFDSMSVAQLAVAAQPTFLVVWVGCNDALGAVTSGSPDALTPTLEFQASLEALLDTLDTSGAEMVMGNIPPVAGVPFATTIQPFLVDPATCSPVLVGGNLVPLLGQTDSGTPGPLDAGARVTLGAQSLLAQGIGIPAEAGGTGNPLPDAVILTPNELTTIEERVDEFNTIIGNLSTEHGIPVVDLAALMADLCANGTEVAGIELAADFVTGGLFSLDGLHPTTVAHGIVANAFIRAINSNYGSNLPESDLNALLSVSSQTQDTGG